MLTRTQVAMACVAVLAQGPRVPAQRPPAPAHLHHIHLNAADPAGSIAFYTSTFESEKARFL